MSPRPTEVLSGFTRAFIKALEILEKNEGDDWPGIFPEGCLSRQEKALLQACYACSVFGGMGSWSDARPSDHSAKEIDRLTERLIVTRSEAFATAVNLSASQIF